MSTAMPLEGRSAPESKTTTFGTASLVFALLTIVLPVLMMILFGYKATQEGQNANSNNGWGDLTALLLLFAGVVFAGIVSGLSSLAGTITGVVALARGERHLWRPIVGLVVNAPVLTMVAFTVIAAWISGNG